MLAPLVLLVGVTAVRVPVRAYEHMRRLSQQKTEFAAITAHELRSPLTAMLGSLRLMKTGRAGPMPETALPYIESASRNSTRLLNLINELLDLDRIEAGMMPFRRDVVRPDELLRLSTDGLAGMSVELGVHISTSCITGRAVRGDPARLQQVVVNLLSNALKHAPRGSTVEVAAEDAGAMVRFTIRDHGPGIAPGDRDRIFQRFVQTGSTAHHPSTGLGLTIAREIVLRHDGRIGVDSESGQGATFWFELRATG